MKKSNFSSLESAVNVFETIEFCKNISSCKFGYGFIARTKPTFVAPKKTEKEWVAVFGCPMEVYKVTMVTNARVYDYEKNINKQLENQGSEGTFKSDSLSGCEWVVPNIIKRSNKDGSLQLVMTFKPKDKTSFKTFYICDGHLASDEEMSFINNHLRDNGTSKKQADMGIAEEDRVLVRGYKFSNIVKVGKTKDVEDFWSSLC